MVQARVVEAALAALGDASLSSAPHARAALGARVVFRAWFHKTPDGIIVEHGNQYDAYCSYRYPMVPFRRKPGEIRPTMGSLVCRLLVSRMGYFNPHVDSSFMLSAFGYLAHWARYYMFCRRSLAGGLGARRAPHARRARAPARAGAARSPAREPRRRGAGDGRPAPRRGPSRPSVRSPGRGSAGARRARAVARPGRAGAARGRGGARVAAARSALARAGGARRAGGAHRL